MANIKDLHPVVKARVEQLQATMDKKLTGNYKMAIVQGFRSMEEQAAIYGQGRKSYIYKGKEYGKPNLPVVSGAKPGQSMHNYGLAIDFALRSKDGKKVAWDTKTDFDKDGKADWMEVVAEAKKLGFVWGGDWKGFVDNPHLEYNFGLDWRDLYYNRKKIPTADATQTKTEPKVVPNFPGLIKKGVTGSSVKLIQKALGIKIDGIFGQQTEDKVKEYQKKHGLVSDGLVGQKTYNSLFH